MTDQSANLLTNKRACVLKIVWLKQCITHGTQMCCMWGICLGWTALQAWGVALPPTASVYFHHGENIMIGSKAGAA